MRPADPVEEFCQAFRRFDSVLAEAIAYGPTPGGDHDFGCLRSWLLAHYASVRPALESSADIQRASDRSVPSLTTSDVFALIFRAPTLAEAVTTRERDLTSWLAAARQIIDHRSPVLSA